MATQQNLAPPAALGHDYEQVDASSRGDKNWLRAVAYYQQEHEALRSFEESRSPTSNVLNLGWFIRSPDSASLRAYMHEKLRERVAEIVAVPAPSPAALAKKIELGMWAAGLGDPETIGDPDMPDVKGDAAQQLLATVYRDALALNMSVRKSRKGKKARRR